MAEEPELIPEVEQKIIEPEAPPEPKEQKIINRILQDMEDLAEEEVERLLNHLMLKRRTPGCCG